MPGRRVQSGVPPAPGKKPSKRKRADQKKVNSYAKDLKRGQTSKPTPAEVGKARRILKKGKKTAAQRRAEAEDRAAARSPSRRENQIANYAGSIAFGMRGPGKKRRRLLPHELRAEERRLKNMARGRRGSKK